MQSLRVTFGDIVFEATSSEAGVADVAPKVPSKPITVAPKERAVTKTTASPSRPVKTPKVSSKAAVLAAMPQGKIVQAEIRDLVRQGRFGEAAIVAENRGWLDQAATLRSKADRSPLPKEALAHRVETPKARKTVRSTKPKASVGKGTPKAVPPPIQQKLDLAQDEANRHQAPTVTKSRQVAKTAQPKVAKRDPNASPAAKRLVEDQRLNANGQRLAGKIAQAIADGPIACDMLQTELRSAASSLLKVVQNAQADGNTEGVRTARALKAQFDKAAFTMVARMKDAGVGHANPRAKALVSA